MEIKESKKEYYQKNKEQISEQRKEYYLKNKEQISEQRKEYYLKNKEQISEQQKEYDKKNKEQISQRKKEHYENNKEKLLLQKKEYREKNREKLLERDRKYYENNKEQRSEYKKTPKGKKSNRISQWKHIGIIFFDYDLLYEIFINTEYCDLCNVKLTEDRQATKTTRCLDHDHNITDYDNVRNILCNSCNIKRG